MNALQGALVIPVAGFVYRGAEGVGVKTSQDLNLFEAANMCLPTDAEVNLFASERGVL